MTRAGDETSTARLIAAAAETASGLRAVAAGKPAAQAMQSDARTFVGIAGLLDLLAAEIERQRSLADTRRNALTRIAELRIRGGAQLVETARWQKIAGELREIAGETLAAEASTDVRVAPRPEKAGSGESRRS